jgi:uncharacterized protein YqjF (DUF2071 family)
VTRLLRGIDAAAGAAEAAVVALDPRSEPSAQAASIRSQSHRPWPLPGGPWLQAQTWRDLLFAHWPLPAERLRGAVSDALSIDTFEGRAWIAITPFEVTGLRLLGTFAVPVLSRFTETNVRTYVTVDDRPGVYFFSLDAASAVAVAAARATYRLPYFRARMAIERSEDGVHYSSTRAGATAELRIRYRPTGAPFQARPGTLEHFLTERYCLYTVVGESVRRAEIHHAPWSLQAAEAELEASSMTEAAGIARPPDAPLLHYAARQDVVIWPPGA